MNETIFSEWGIILIYSVSVCLLIYIIGLLVYVIFLVFKIKKINKMKFNHTKIILSILALILIILLIGFLPIHDCGHQLANYTCSAYDFLPY